MNWWIDEKVQLCDWWIDELMKKVQLCDWWIDELMKKVQLCYLMNWWIDEQNWWIDEKVQVCYLMNWWIDELFDELMKCYFENWWIDEKLTKTHDFWTISKDSSLYKISKIQRFLNISTYCSENKAVREICIFVRETGITRPVYMVPEDAPDNNSLNLYWFGCLHSFLTKTVFMCSVMLVFAHLEVCKCFCQASFPHARTFC